MNYKDILQERFLQQFPDYRLLGVALGDPAHIIYYDEGMPDDSIRTMIYSEYAENDISGKLKKLFVDFPKIEHYRHNPVEYIYVLPIERSKKENE
jgi:hypothetical protein